MPLFQHYQFRELARQVHAKNRHAAFHNVTGAWLAPWITEAKPKYWQR